MTEFNDYDSKLIINQIKELAERSLRDGEPKWTGFLEPPVLEQLQAVLSWVNGVRFRAYGGYKNAEHKRLVIYPDYYLEETIQPALAYLAIVPEDPDIRLTHRDYLGAITGLGIKREKIGDLLVTNSACQLILVPELSSFVISELKKVNTSAVTITEIDSEQLNAPDLREKVIKTTVASLRLDSIAAAGFGESRAKMAREIKALRLKVNWKAVDAPDYALNPGDVISIRGRGRVIFREMTGRSKKGRIGVLLIRLL